jgi:PAS domain S-box-containing protein
VTALPTPPASELQVLLESVSDGFFCLDRAWRFTYLNPAAARILDCEPGRLLGQVLWQEYPGVAGSGFEALYRTTMHGAPRGTVTAWYDDHQRWYEVTACATESGMAVCFRDVSERMNREARARAEAASFQRMIDANPYGVHVVDSSFIVRYANLRARKAFASFPQLVGTDLRTALRAIWPASVAEEIVSTFERVLATGRSFHSVGTVGKRADVNRVEAYDWTVERLALPGGGEGLVTHFFDLTERERLLDAERLARTRSETLQRLTAELAEARTPDAVAQATLEAGCRVLGSRQGSVFCFTEQGAPDTLDLVAAYGYDEALLDRYRRIPADAPMPYADALRTGQEVAICSAADLVNRYPEAEPLVREAGLHGTVVCPLRRVGPGAEGRSHFGFVGFDFDRDRDSDEEEIRFLATLAKLCAQALDRAAATAALKVRDEQLRLFIEHAPAAIAMLDRDMRYVAASRRFVEDYRLRDTLLIGRSHYEMFPELPQHWRDVHARCLAGATERSDADMLDRADGSIDWIRWEMRPWRASNGDVGGVMLFSEIVTERRNAESALRASEERRALAMRAGRMAAWDYDVTTGRNTWDGRLGELLGMAPGEAERTADRWVEVVHEEDRPRVVQEFHAALEDRAPYETEFRVRNARGIVHWLATAGHVVRDEGGRPQRLVGIVQDITATKRLEEDLRAADRRKDVFLATLAHELRNPLAPIRTAAELLAHPKLDTQQLSWAQAVIQRQVGHMALLLDDLLDVSRITRGKLTLKRETVTFASVVDAAVETARPLLDRKQHEMNVELPSGELVLNADPLRLSQVFSNLLNNAAKYTDPGGHVALTARVEQRTVVVEVSDDGIGIAPDAITHVFEMFGQIDGALKQAEGGLGIGLALVKGLVELHGGTISASSAGKGQGSVFTVRLPNVIEFVPSVEAQRTPGRAQAGRRVLVVDDNADSADSLAMALRLAGHEVRVAYRARAALALAHAFRPEVAILDIGIPDMSGYELARALRAEEWAVGLRLVALTGWGQDDDRRRAQEAGFDAHLTKPAEPRRVQDAIHGESTGQ